jgi:hypothetical protein
MDRRLLKTTIIAISVTILSASTTFAACTPALGRYGGAESGIYYNSAGKIVDFYSGVWSLNFKSDGSATARVVSPSGEIKDFTLTARGTAQHTWDGTRCTGYMYWVRPGHKMELRYSVVNSGQEINAIDIPVEPDKYPYIVQWKRL